MFALILDSLGSAEILLIIALILFFCMFVLLTVMAVKAFGRISKAERDLKKCKFCAEFIKQEAIVCRYCNRDLK